MPNYNYRVWFTRDTDARFEECNGEPRPLTEAEYAENHYNAPDGTPVPYAEYLRYYGNPDRHVYIGVMVDRQPAAGGKWTIGVASLWNIDLMDDAPELDAVELVEDPAHASYTAEQALTLPGYLAEVAREVLAETDYQFPPEAYCAERPNGCRYFHVSDATQDRRYCGQHQPPKEDQQR